MVSVTTDAVAANSVGSTPRKMRWLPTMLATTQEHDVFAIVVWTACKVAVV